MSRVPRFFIDGTLRAHTETSIAGGAHHHLAHVLRLRSGAKIELFNGDGANYRASVLEISRHATRVRIEARSDGLAPGQPPVTLQIGISKPKLFDLALQKSTELGVAAISPLLCERSPRERTRDREKQAAHWRSVVVSAAEQCGRAELPILAAPVSADSLTVANEADALRLLLEPGGDPLPTGGDAPAMVSLAVGPEGGFTDTEKQHFVAQGFQPVSCGPRILRTETAPLAMLAIVQYLWGDFR